MDIVTGVGVLDKAMHIVRAVAVAPRSPVELPDVTGLPRATASRLALALEQHGVLRRDVDGRFELGHGLTALGSIAGQRFPLATSGRPLLEQLRRDTGEGVQLFVREGEQRRCIVSLESPHALRWIVPQGSLLPLHVGSAGRVLSGERGRHGWVESVGEREVGAASVSAPVCDPSGGVVAAVSVSGPIERLSKSPGRRFGAHVVAAAASLSALVDDSEHGQRR